MFELQDQFNKIFNFEYLYEFEAAFFWLWNIFFLAVGGVEDGCFLKEKLEIEFICIIQTDDLPSRWILILPGLQYSTV